MNMKKKNKGGNKSISLPESIPHKEELSKDILVSIIIPIYNAAAYLKRCLDSVLRQTFQNLEIILVNDGSQDESLEICKEYAHKDLRIYVLSIKNSGVSVSRNLALDIARGKYIRFVDSDDWITCDSTEILVRKAEETDSDFVIADFYRVGGKRYSIKTHVKEENVMNRKDFAFHMMQEPADFYYGVLWNKLYRRDLIQKNHLRCQEGLNWCEDFLFNLSYIRQAERFCAVQAPIYYYVKNKGSLVAMEVTFRNTLKVRSMLLRDYRKLYQELGLYEENKAKINAFLIAVARDGHVSKNPISRNNKKLDKTMIIKAPTYHYSFNRKKEKKAGIENGKRKISNY